MTENGSAHFTAGAPAAIPDEAEHALRFSHAREAQSNALVEDYVELIADLLLATREARTTVIAKRFGVSHPTAIKNIARLKSLGLVESQPYRGIFLTAEGEKLAKKSRARHRLIVGLLMKLGVPAEAAELDSEGIEHHVSEVTLKAFERFMKS